MKAHRLERVAEAVREVASETILFELRDPRVKLVTVTRAEVSGDLQHAKVYVSVMGTPKEQQLTLRGLKHAAGFVQSKLAKRLQTRFTPVVQFVLDQGVKNHRDVPPDQGGPGPAGRRRRGGRRGRGACRAKQFCRGSGGRPRSPVTGGAAEPRPGRDRHP
jgi:ribosome-binding factor A